MNRDEIVLTLRETRIHTERAPPKHDRWIRTRQQIKEKKKEEEEGAVGERGAEIDGRDSGSVVPNTSSNKVNLVQNKLENVNISPEFP